ADRKALALLFENEINTSGDMLDRARANIAGYAHALVERGAPKRAKLGNRVIVGLTLCKAHVGEGNERHDDDSRTHEKFCAGFHAGTPVIETPINRILAQGRNPLESVFITHICDAQP